MSQSSLQVITFKAGKYHFGIDVMSVQEVLPAQRMTSVPLAPRVINGLINLRGEIVTALDVRERLQVGATSSGIESMNIIVRTQEGPISLVVDDIGDVLDVEFDHVTPAPDHLAPQVWGIIHAVYKLKDSLLLLLDIEQLSVICPLSEPSNN